MKKTFIFILVTILMLVLSLQAFGANLEIGEFDYKVYNDVYNNFNENKGLVKFDTKEMKAPIIMFEDYARVYVFNIDKSFRRELVEAVNKYLEWNKKAVDEEVEIEKEISSKHYTAGFYSSDEWYFDNMVEIEFRFFSQNTKRHQLIISVGKMEAEYISANMENVYLDKNEAIALKEMLTEEAIEDAKKEIKKQKDVESEFN